MASDETKSLTDEVEPVCSRTEAFHPTDEVGGSGFLLGLENHSSVWQDNRRSMPQKNALVLLHDFRPDLEFRLISKTGPEHSPTFTMAVEVNGELFFGQGKRKKQAKLQAAHNLLTSIIQFKDTHEDMGCPKSDKDFTSDNIDITNSLCTSFSRNAISHADEFVREKGDKNNQTSDMSLVAGEDNHVGTEYATPSTSDLGTQTKERETTRKKKGRYLKIWRRFCDCFIGCVSRKRKNE